MKPTESLSDPTIRGRATPTAPAGALAIGSVLADRYRILERLGEGGMGVVYRARDLTLDADIALKVLHPAIADDPDKLAFFRNEVRVARMVTHPNVCRLHDLEEGDAGCFITMEYVAGEPLSARLERGRMSLDDATRVLRDVAAGLAAAHAAGVIHRDLKPSNVVMAGDRATWSRAVVADFGIAASGCVAPGEIAGTSGFMAPEQAAGGAIDARADVYALGVLGFVLATGGRPRPHGTITTGGSAAAFPIAELDRELSGLPPVLADLLARCLEPDPADRPANAGEVVRWLDANRRRRARWPYGLAAAGVIGAALAAFALWPRGSVATAHGAPHVIVAPVDAVGLPAVDAWLAPALQRQLVNELVDGWGVDATAASPSLDAVVVRGTLSRAPGGALRFVSGGIDVEARSTRDLAIAAAARIIAASVPAELQRPTPADLRRAGTADAEAWRLWRRAQREGLMGRWGRVLALDDEAMKRDPRFPLALLDRALAYDNRDTAGAAQLAEATRLVDANPDVSLVWRLAATAADHLNHGRIDAAAKLVDTARKLELEPRERMWVELRTSMAAFYNGDRVGALPALQLMTETYPDDASAFKLLADFYATSEQPTAPALALRYATRALALAPDDVGSRADLAIAMLLNGRIDDARARAAEIARVDPEDKRLARARLFNLHMALGDPAEADVDARRMLTGSDEQRVAGTAAAALLDLYWGRFDAGLRGLAAAGDAFEALGETTSAARQRFSAGRHALMLGDRDGAARIFARVASGTSGYAPVSGVLAALAAGRLDAAAERAAAIGDPAARATAELELADARHDAAGVLVAQARLEKVSSTIESLYEVGDALERAGRADEATAAFERLTRSPNAWSEPIASTRAWYRLGLLRERAGDAAGARAAFTEVVTRWGNATRPMPEVTGARKRLRAP